PRLELYDERVSAAETRRAVLFRRCLAASPLFLERAVELGDSRGLRARRLLSGLDATAQHVEHGLPLRRGQVALQLLEQRTLLRGRKRIEELDLLLSRDGNLSKRSPRQADCDAEQRDPCAANETSEDGFRRFHAYGSHR